MLTAVALLRGINVGSTRSLPMKQLCELCEGVGLQRPRTYIQSGNVVFNAAKRDLAAAAARLEAAIEADHGFRPDVIIRTRDELAAAIEANPFADRGKSDPAKLLIMFLRSAPTVAVAKAIESVRRETEQLRLIGREVYIEFPKGVGKSKLSLAAVEKVLGIPGTTRNWNTTLKLLDMADEPGHG